MAKWSKGGRLLFEVNLYGKMTGWGKVESYDPFTNTGVVEYNLKMMENGRVQGIRKYRYEVTNLKIKDGKIVSLGNIVKVRKGFGFQSEVRYRYGGMSRLNNGFMTLMTQLRMSGVSEETIRYLTNLFESLSDQDKVRFFSDYQQSNLVLTYGSDAIKETDQATDGNAYAELIQNILEHIVS